MEMETLRSLEDYSVNFVFRDPEQFPGFIEARYVRRAPEYFACYLSSQTGCGQACRMCHLTASGQNKFRNVTATQYLDQVNAVFRHYDLDCPPAGKVHFNFMARGEALDNPLFLADGEDLLYKMGKVAVSRQLIPRFLISTILPKSFSGNSLSKVFPIVHPEIYYSIYSIHDEFRKKWLPRAMPLDEAFAILLEYQRNTREMIKFHWAFIEGENDSIERDIAPMCWRIRDSKLRVDIAIVRYNPYSEKYGRESDEAVIDRNLEAIRALLPFSNIKKITRVGRDVKASCGMFVEPH